MEQILANSQKSSSNTDLFFNPFPGLRPFSIDESHLFFGREGQSDEVLKKLSDNHFAAVIGASGSGKSSLIYCGLIPILYGGFITNTSSSWHTIVTRPGSGPIDNLAQAVVEGAHGHLEGEDRELKEKIISTILRGSSQGLVEVLKQLKRPKNENIFILLDQFEELFRFKRSRTDKSSDDEAAAYIKLFVEAINQRELPVYVVLTMRSDFIGDCAQFPDLTKKINNSHYLIPQMTRENLKDAITGPVAVGGGDISKRLVHELLNSVGDNPDHLPILQHSLMRTWEFWSQNRAHNEPMDLKHYDAIGRMEKALSQHANEAYDELNEEEKELCQRLFKTLTEKAGDNRGIRHPSTLLELMTISGASKADIMSVVERFRVQGRSFLTPPQGHNIEDRTIIDISHESLMRVWDRLTFWVEEEAQSIHMYTRLSEAAKLYQEGKTTLWRPPDLQLALNWRDRYKPNLAWAERFHPAFERTMVFLDTSSSEYETEEQNKILQQKRTLRRTRTFAIVLGVAAIMSLGLMVFSMIQSREAKKQREIAIEQSEEAEKQRLLAISESEEAAKQREIAVEKAEEAKQNLRKAEKEAERAEFQKSLALKNAQIAEENEQIAKANALEARKNAQEAKRNYEEALAQQQIAEKAQKDAYRLRMLSVAKTMSLKSLKISKDHEKKGAIALTAYNINTRYEGKKYDPDIYDGLYYAVNSLTNGQYNDREGIHTGAVRGVCLTNSVDSYSAGMDGRIVKWTGENGEIYYKGDRTLIDLDFNSKRKALAFVDGRNLIGVISTSDSTDIKLLKGARPMQVEFLNASNLLVLENGGVVNRSIDDTLKTIVVSDTMKVVKFDLDKRGDVAYVTKSGEVAIIDESGEPRLMAGSVSSPTEIIVSNEGGFIAVGDNEGLIKIWDTGSGELLTTLEGQSARISDLKFSSDDSMLASGSFDGSVMVWRTNAFNDQPLVLRDHDTWIYAVNFSPKGGVLFAGARDGEIKPWFTSTEAMAEEICPKMKRNLSQREWIRYVADDIPYEKSCANLPEGE